MTCTAPSPLLADLALTLLPLLPVLLEWAPPHLAWKPREDARMSTGAAWCSAGHPQGV